ncbi:MULTISPECIES: ABC transporter substrate-binding protein [unclassified Bradyrhizobium]|uniref:ABC transporter substrate-binding protein n=1 Tax=unclassified Bradyrhizobium TaxID=2631580 RepID=UPI001FFF3A14|nr:MULTISPECIES: ABC transporter substrate-binding protein [unclassified Bradyrhizobium]
MAERWERINAQSLRLFLRKEVAFHDGTPLTAEDVAFSLGPDHLLGPGRSGMSEALQSLDRLKKVEIVDPYTVVVHAKRRRRAPRAAFGCLGDRRSPVSAPSWRRARGSGGPQPLLEAVLTSSSKRPQAGRFAESMLLAQATS